MLDEPHFAPDELAKLWSVSADTIRRLFDDEPGVIALESPRKRGKRRYRLIRIPKSVAERVYGRLKIQRTQ